MVAEDELLGQPRVERDHHVVVDLRGQRRVVAHRVVDPRVAVVGLVEVGRAGQQRPVVRDGSTPGRQGGEVEVGRLVLLQEHDHPVPRNPVSPLAPFRCPSRAPRRQTQPSTRPGGRLGGQPERRAVSRLAGVRSTGLVASSPHSAQRPVVDTDAGAAAPSFRPPCGQGDDSSGWLRSTRVDTRSSSRCCSVRSWGYRPARPPDGCSRTCCTADTESVACIDRGTWRAGPG